MGNGFREVVAGDAAPLDYGLDASGQVKHGYLRPGVQPHRGKRGPDAAIDIEMAALQAVEALGIGGHQVGQAEVHSWQA